MTAGKKINEAERILEQMQNSTGTNLQDNLNKFVSTIHDIFSQLLDDYNKKFDVGIKGIGLDKFKSKARKAGKIDAIKFLIWYEKEYKKIKDDQYCGPFLEKNPVSLDQSNPAGLLDSCSKVLNEAKKITYYAYENF